MEQITLDHINKNILLLRQEIERVADIVGESYLDLDDEINKDVEISRKRKKDEFISHEKMREEFGR